MNSVGFFPILATFQKKRFSKQNDHLILIISTFHISSRAHLSLTLQRCTPSIIARTVYLPNNFWVTGKHYVKFELERAVFLFMSQTVRRVTWPW